MPSQEDSLFSQERLLEEQRANATCRAYAAARDVVWALCALAVLTVAALGTYCLAPREIAIELTVYVLLVAIVICGWGIVTVLRRRVRAAVFLCAFLTTLLLMFLALHASILIWILSPYLKWM